MLLLMLVMPRSAHAVAVETELIAEIRQSVRSAQGVIGHRFVRATVVPQGEVVYYTVRVRNPSATAYARDVVIEQKIPQNTMYVVGSAAGPAVEVSLSTDGGRTYVLERRASGAQQGEANPRCTHIRWRFRNALAPGAVALARFRAIFG